MRRTSTTAAAQPGIAVDRFAREIVGFLKASPSALAATECQPVGPHSTNLAQEVVCYLWYTVP